MIFYDVEDENRENWVVAIKMDVIFGLPWCAATEEETFDFDEQLWWSRLLYAFQPDDNCTHTRHF